MVGNKQEYKDYIAEKYEWTTYAQEDSSILRNLQLAQDDIFSWIRINELDFTSNSVEIQQIILEAIYDLTYAVMSSSTVEDVDINKVKQPVYRRLKTNGFISF